MQVVADKGTEYPASLRVCIHRGADQVGGTCIELEAEDKRIVLDIGVPLDADNPATVTMPEGAM
jgi:ribonuclease J